MKYKVKRLVEEEIEFKPGMLFKEARYSGHYYLLSVIDSRTYGLINLETGLSFCHSTSLEELAEKHIVEGFVYLGYMKDMIKEG